MAVRPKWAGKSATPHWHWSSPPWQPTKSSFGRMLRDSYVAWAMFYTEAVRKIRAEAQANILRKPDKRAGIQLWHLFVVLVLWADVSETVTGNAITNFLQGLFTF